MSKSPFSIAAALAALALALLSGCASGPGRQMYTQTFDGAFVASDGHLYLFTPIGDQTLRVDAAPFRAYRALMDSPLQSAVACARMYLRMDWQDPANQGRVDGRYGLLLRAEQVTPAQAAQFGLQRLKVTAQEAAIADNVTRKLSRPPNGDYEFALDPACKLPATGGSYYSAVFQSQGQWVQLPDRAALAARSRWPQPIVARMDRTNPPSASSGSAVAGAAGEMLGAALAPVALPVFVLAIPFLGPDHWK
ncbi:MAG: hypothetical protein ACN6O3_03000 [Comamonas sp.]